MELIDSLVLHYPQVQAFTVANLKARYRKTVAGFLWVIINPLIMFATQCLVFRIFLRIQVPNYALFLLSGLLPWIFVTQSMQMCTNTFVAASQLLKSFQLPPLVHLFALLLDNLINFLAAFLLILGPLLIAHPVSIARLALLPVAVALLLLGVVGMTWILATVQVFFRDTVFIVNFVISVLFFLTPVFYPESYIPESYRFLIHINPIYQLIRPFHSLLLASDWTETRSSFIAATLVATLSLFSAGLLWSRKKNEIYFYI